MRPYALYVGPVLMGRFYTEWQAQSVNRDRFLMRGTVKKETN